MWCEARRPSVTTHWQALVGWHFGEELWANLPEDMTRTLEDAARELQGLQRIVVLRIWAGQAWSGSCSGSSC